MIFDGDDRDLVVKIYKEMLKYPWPAEKTWATSVFDPRSKYSIPLNDKNIASIAIIAKSMWKIIVKTQVKKLTFQPSYEASLANKKAKHLRYPDSKEHPI